jgi:hypothetical protein
MLLITKLEVTKNIPLPIMWQLKKKLFAALLWISVIQLMVGESPPLIWRWNLVLPYNKM